MTYRQEILTAILMITMTAIVCAFLYYIQPVMLELR